MSEVLYNCRWEGVILSEFMGILNDYLGWYNGKQIKVSPANMSPLGPRRSLGIAA